jgi:hypothetical protein
VAVKKKAAPARPQRRPNIGPTSSRGLVIAALKQYPKNTLNDDDGFATARLHADVQALGSQVQQEGLSSLLRKMEKEGQIARDVAYENKRCYQIRLVSAEPQIVNVPATKPKVTKAAATSAPAKRGPGRPRKVPVEAVEEPVGDGITEDEISILLPFLVDQIGEDRVIDVLLSRAARSGVDPDEVENRISRIEQEWADKLAAVSAELNQVKVDAAALALQYDERLTELRDVRAEMADLQKTSNELLNDAAKQIGDLQGQLAERTKPKRTVGVDELAAIQNVIDRRSGGKSGPVKG